MSGALIEQVIALKRDLRKQEHDLDTKAMEIYEREPWVKDPTRDPLDLIPKEVETKRRFLEFEGQQLAPHELPESLLKQLGDAMSAADPQADTELALECPACAHCWNEPFDVGSYLLDSLEHWAERCLDQVHTLAQAYGWTEAQILALSPSRRARYIARVLS